MKSETYFKYCQWCGQLLSVVIVDDQPQTIKCPGCQSEHIMGQPVAQPDGYWYPPYTQRVDK